ncbi:MAG: HAMP domain-containing histidine kinase [Clostridia bacterium]|nr:HAMP domain-containing histidine kinase [Clostridia bacterium]
MMLYTRSGIKGEKPFVSLRIKFAAVMIIGAIITVCGALLVIPPTATLLTRVYMNPARMDERLDRYIQNFNDFVTENQISSEDAASVAQWSLYHRNVHLVVFGGENKQFGVVDGEILDGSTPVLDTPVFTENFEMNESAGSSLGSTYFVRFSNGVYTVSVVDYSGQAFYNGLHWAGVILAIIMFFLVLLVYYHLQIKALLKLSVEVEEVSSGDLTALIHAERNDEIGGLARDVDNMRATILKKMEEEKATREANGELITSMSHDIRTPLTTLLGYMELLQNDCENMKEEQKAYVRLCAEKAEQIKELSDKLFLYFWAYNAREDKVDTEPCDMMLLGEQMIGEWLQPMEYEGLSLDVFSDSLPEGTCVAVNTECLRRIIDNLFDNIRKYASRKEAVRIILSATENNEVCMTFQNAVTTSETQTTGTHIGHKTCQNMAKLMGARFETTLTDSHFEARLYVKIVK